MDTPILWLVFVGIASEKLYSKLIYVNLGESVDIFCDLDIASETIVTWLVPPNRTIYAIGESINEKEYSTLQLNINENTLKIQNFSEDQQGIYRCLTKSHDMDFDVQMKVDPTNLTIRNETQFGGITVTEGLQYELQCNVKRGRPREKISWSLDGIVLETGDSGEVSYRFYPQRRHHNKRYTCKVFREPDQIILKRNIRLFVYYVPKVSITVKPSLTVVEGDTVTLYCVHDSNDPEATFQWKPECRSSYKEYQSTCTLKNITRQQYTHFECQVQSKTGVTRDTTSLYIQYAPDISIAERNINTSSVELVCKADGIPKKICFSRWEHQSTNGSHIRFLSNFSTIILKKNSYNDTGIYVCNVTNGVSNKEGDIWIHKSFRRKFIGKPHFTRGTPTIQYARIGFEKLVYLNVVSVDNITAEVLSDKKAKRTDKKVPDITVSHKLINDVIYGQQVKVEGYKIFFIINITSKISFRNYNICVQNKKGVKIFNVEIKPADKPVKPSMFIAFAHQKGIGISWNSGFNGGFPQSFVVQFRQQVEVTWEEINPISESNQEKYSTTIANLLPNTKYCFRMYAFNSVSSSNFTDKLCLKTSLYVPERLVLILCVSVLIVLCVMVLICYRICFRKDKKEEKFPNSQITSINGNSVRSRENSNLNYIDVWFEKKSKKRKFHVHGADNRTHYAVVDLTIKADPLPETSSSEDDDSEHGMTHEIS